MHGNEVTQDLASFPGSCAWNEVTQDLPLTLSSIPTPDCILHFSSPSHFHDYHQGLIGPLKVASMHGCTSAITVSASALLCDHTILHVPPPPHGTGYCRTNMCTKCQTVPWVSRTHQLWWRSPPLNPYRSYSSPGS